MLEQIVKTAYKEFTLRFYHELFARFQDQETGLTAAEIFAAEAIRALGSPTVNEFADFMHVSTPNAAYKINSLVRKGYVEKTRSAQDKREYLLHVTQEIRDLLRRGRPRAERRGPHPGALFPGGVRQIRRDALGHQRGAAAFRRRAARRPGPPGAEQTVSRPDKTQIKTDQLQNWSVFCMLAKVSFGALSK